MSEWNDWNRMREAADRQRREVSCDPLYNALALDAARRIASDLRRPKSAREEALRVVRKLEAALA